MYCQNCGSENKDGAKFCRQCGSELLGAEISVSSNGSGNPAKPKKKAKKSIVACSVIAILIVALTIVCFTVDFKKIALNDFEYYLYLEKKNAEEFVGEGFISLTENFDSFSAESTLTGSMSGAALNYDSNFNPYQLASVLEKSSLMLKTDFNGADVLNFDADWIKNGSTSVLDLIITVFNGDVIVGSDSITNNTYSLSKTLGSNVNVGKVKSALKNLLLAAYEHFGEFEEYITVDSTTYDGEKATKTTFDFHYVFITEFTEYIIDYWVNDEALISLTENIFSVLFELDGYSIQEELEEEGYVSFADYFKEGMKDGLLEYVKEEKAEIEYIVTSRKDGDILKREFFYRELEDGSDDITIISDTILDSSDNQITRINVEGYEILSADNSDDKISLNITLPDEDLVWDLTCTYDEKSIDLSFYGRDNSYWCGSQYNYYTDSYDYKRDVLILELGLKTDFSKYAFTPNSSITESAKALTENEVENLLTTISKSISYSFESELYGMTD